MLTVNDFKNTEEFKEREIMINILFLMSNEIVYSINNEKLYI